MHLYTDLAHPVFSSFFSRCKDSPNVKLCMISKTVKQYMFVMVTFGTTLNFSVKWSTWLLIKVSCSITAGAEYPNVEGGGGH